jgi:hypothetical protein
VSAVTVLVASVATAAATGLGALPFVAVRHPGRSWLGDRQRPGRRFHGRRRHPKGWPSASSLVPRGSSVKAAACWSIFSSLPQPLTAVPAFVFVESFAGALPVGLGFAAGAMAWLAVVDLLPEALRSARPVPVLTTAVSAATVMLAFQLALL